MTPSRRQSSALTQVMAGQMSLFAAYRPPTFDEMCPPPGAPQGDEEQLGFEIDAGIRAANQTSVYDYDC